MIEGFCVFLSFDNVIGVFKYELDVKGYKLVKIKKEQELKMIMANESLIIFC
jgi:hypothetical protein